MPDRFNLFPTNELIAQYRKVFSSPEGQQVLVHIMYDLGVFTEISGADEDIALKNYGIRLMNILGGGDPSSYNIKDFMYKLMKQPLAEIKNDE